MTQRLPGSSYGVPGFPEPPRTGDLLKWDINDDFGIVIEVSHLKWSYQTKLPYVMLDIWHLKTCSMRACVWGEPESKHWSNYGQ